MSLRLMSPAFTHRGLMDARYTGEGRDVSPPLVFSGVPHDARTLALTCEDPDAGRREPWVHWLLYDVPADVRALAEGVPRSRTLSTPPGARQGRNTWGEIGYKGPMPPRGELAHTYHFKLYALRSAVERSGLEFGALADLMDREVLEMAVLIGRFERASRA